MVREFPSAHPQRRQRAPADKRRPARDRCRAGTTQPDLRQFRDRSQLKPATVLAINTPALSRKAELSQSRFATASRAAAIASRSLREYRESAPFAGSGNPQTWAVVPSKPGYTSFVGARQHLPDNMPACRQSKPDAVRADHANTSNHDGFPGVVISMIVNSKVVNSKVVNSKISHGRQPARNQKNSSTDRNGSSTFFPETAQPGPKPRAARVAVVDGPGMRREM